VPDPGTESQQQRAVRGATQHKRPTLVWGPQVAAPLQQEGSTHAPFDPQTCPSGQQPGPHTRRAGQTKGGGSGSGGCGGGGGTTGLGFFFFFFFLRFFLAAASSPAKARGSVASQPAVKLVSSRRRDVPMNSERARASKCCACMANFLRRSRCAAMEDAGEPVGRRRARDRPQCRCRTLRHSLASASATSTPGPFPAAPHRCWKQ
jgi:hypothetical protein